MGRTEAVAIVGRSAELATAGRLLRRALEGSPAVLVIGGEAGIGKTRLVGELIREARDLGFRGGLGSCVRMDAGATPYAALIAALRQLVRDAGPDAVAGTLGAGRRDVARLLPEVARLGVPVTSARQPGPPGPETGRPPVPMAAPMTAPVPSGPFGASDNLERMRLFEAVSTWLARFAEDAPIVLAVEDLQWADAATLDLLRSVALVPDGRMVLAVTFRTDEPLGPSAAATLAELVRDGATRLELMPLDRPAVAALAAEVLGGDPDPSALDVLLARSGGNPFLALELIAAGVLDGPDSPYAGVPPSLRDILDARLVTLGDATLSVLRAAALHPGPVDDELLAEVLDRPVREIGDALREARDAGVLAAGPSGPMFRHALQREALMGQLGPGEQRFLHGCFASALAATLDDPSRAGVLAHHCDAAGDDAGSLAAHVAAMRAAADSFAFDAAAGHAERAAELRLRRPAEPPAPDLPDAPHLIESASLFWLLAGDPARSAVLARGALPLAEDDPDLAAALHDRVRWALWEAGDHEGARLEVEQSFARLPPGASPMRTRLTALLAAMRMEEADPGPALALADTAVADASGSPALRDVEALALGVRGRTIAMHGRVDDGLADLRAALAIADELENLQGRLVGIASIVEVLARCGRARDALVEIDRAGAIAEASGLGRSLGTQLAAEAARSCFAIGLWDEAERRVAEGLGRRPAASVEARLRVVGLRLAAARGDLSAASNHEGRLAVLEAALMAAEDRAALAVARAELALSSGAPDAVAGLLDRLLESGAAEAPGSSLAWLGVLAVRAAVEVSLAALARGDGAAAGLAADRGTAIAGMVERGAAQVGAAWGPRSAALVAQLGAELSRLGDAAGRRVEAWREVAAAWEAIDRPYFAALARVRLAEALLGAGATRSVVGEPLASAIEVLRRLRAAPGLAEAGRIARLAHVREPVARDGDETERPAAGSGDPLAALQLTMREREVLRRVAAGWSNARIADELSISPKTASVHVSNILAKLGVENRVEAAALAHRLGVAGSQDDEGSRPRG